MRACLPPARWPGLGEMAEPRPSTPDPVTPTLVLNPHQRERRQKGIKEGICASPCPLSTVVRVQVHDGRAILGLPDQNKGRGRQESGLHT